jgi:phage protein D
MPPLRPGILINETDSPALTVALLDLSVIDDGRAPSRCEARFANWGRVGAGSDYLFFDRRLLDFGARLRVTLADVTVFDGRVVAIDAGYDAGAAATIGVCAEDRLRDLAMVRRTRMFERMTDFQIVSQIAADHGMSAQAPGGGPAHPAVPQPNQTDLEFLHQRLAPIDASLWVEGNMLHAQSTAARDHGTVVLRQGAELRQLSVVADVRASRNRVVVSGWDVGRRTPIEESATDAVIAAELAGRLSSASILTTAFGQREERIVDAVPLSAAEARARATSVFRGRARQFVAARGVCVADGRVRVGAYVDLQQVGSLFSGRYHVTAVQHQFDNTGGLRTWFCASAPGLAAP